ncbi:hypothetical protein [Flavobacterium ginsengiterrae]|uniref:Peptidase S74 domain-containing protein n=1 Tax=Flavobacterium ginsengiterrae TaxID=871695 RepID=A0ABP7GWY2_9FLAO
MKKTFLIIFIVFQTLIYSQTFDLGTNSLKWTREQKDFNSPPRAGVSDMSLKLWDNYTGTNAPSQYGTLLEIYGLQNHLISHLYFNNNWEGGQIMYRSAFYNENIWGEWRNLLDSKSNVASSGNLIIEGTGNNGIGTNNPEKKFQINASNDDAGLRIHTKTGDNNTNTPYLLLTGGYFPNNGVALQGVSDGGYGRKALAFYSGWQGNTDSPAISDLQERMRISSNGFVGIGTKNPETALNVNIGSGGSNGTAAIRVGGLTNYSSLELGIDGDYDGMIRSYGNNINYYAGHWKTKGTPASENHSHNWYTSKNGSSDWSSIKMTLNENGNLGIGTTNPKNKLDVNGTIHSKEVKVDLDFPAPDYVFANDYKLKTLDEVESYISKNSHLPEIPSAKEFEKNGIYLAQMNMALLKKIEELTLYTIQQNKKIIELELKNKKLEDVESRLKKLEEKAK